MNITEPRKLLMVLPSAIIFFLNIPAGSVLVGQRIDEFLGFQALKTGYAGILVALIFLVGGGYYVLESMRVLFTKGEGIPLGDLFPEDQSSELITTGIYAQTRNPMLFGYLLCLISLGLVANSTTTTFITPLLFITIWTIWVKIHEEPALENRFGESYNEYRKKTPYLVPRTWKRTE